MTHGNLNAKIAVVEQHAAEGDQQISRQLRIIADLEAAGHDTIGAHELLRTLRSSQALHMADRDWLLRELAGR